MHHKQGFRHIESGVINSRHRGVVVGGIEEQASRCQVPFRLPEKRRFIGQAAFPSRRTLRQKGPSDVLRVFSSTGKTESRTP